MNKVRHYLIGVLIGVLAAGGGMGILRAQSQGIVPAGATPVTQTASRADAAAICQSSASSAATITFTPQGTQSVYVAEVDFQNVVGASAVTAAASTTVTTTNLPGNPAWQMASGTSAGSATQSFSISYPFGLRSSTPGTAVTFVLPAFATNQTIRVNVCAYFA